MPIRLLSALGAEGSEFESHRPDQYSCGSSDFRRASKDDRCPRIGTCMQMAPNSQRLGPFCWFVRIAISLWAFERSRVRAYSVPSSY